ncbi:MAG: B12-binding domain-containing radical SAM protein [Thermoplasmatota archaeon]|jgi:radical SAM superfamily enzyme YgiQ (UPF0313 family)
MKVLFIHPASGVLEFSSKDFIKTGALLPPLGLLYLAGMLEKNGYEAEILDCNSEEISENKIKKIIRSFDAVGMTIYSEEYEQKNSRLISDIIRESDSEIPIIIGGAHCTLLPEQSLIDHKADICVQGRGDSLIVPIVEALMGKKDLSSIPNIYFRKGKKIHYTKSAKIDLKLDELPYPARHLVDKYDYGFLHGQRIAKGRLTSIITSRGCAYRCNFCNLHAHIPELELRSSENILKEIEDISNKGYKTLVFVDDNFISRKKLVIEVMDYIIKQKLDLRLWIWEARIDAADRSLFEKMRDAGTEAINFGIESGCQEILDYYNKKITIQQIKDAVSLSKEMGFLVTATFIIGSPIETKKHIKKTIKFSSSLPLDSAIFYLFQYTYKSKFWEDCVKQGKIRTDEFRVIPDIRRGLGNFTSEELMNFTRIAYINFFMNPSRWLRTCKVVLKFKDKRTFFQGLQITKQIMIGKSFKFN